MAQYRVVEKSYLGGQVVEEGEIVEYEGEAGPNLELVPKGKTPKKTDDSLV